MAMICSSCGAEVRDGAQFCPECGKKIQGENKVSPKVQIPVVNTKNTAKKSSPIDNVLIAALSVVMIAELVIIAYVKPGILRTDHESLVLVARSLLDSVKSEIIVLILLCEVVLDVFLNFLLKIFKIHFH